MMRIALLGALVAMTGIGMAEAGDDSRRAVAGPVAATVLKVRDGDTLEVEALIWPNQIVRTAVRLRGIDAPELKGRCAAERDAAGAARDRLAALLADGPVALSDIAGDRYFGRVLATVSAGDVPDVSRRLLAEGLAVGYRGEARRDWCAGAAASWLRSDGARTPG